ncbi:ras family-domain-containing protein [Rhypophila decipiens]|uniref:Ras family-domain-containing protein n=1 Tax=Rhypophila decipiens TaxID=261697 RepID=A0AAN6YJ40_9PEZI|nr:ras family-domain-containing protein [Rhypophila decipiens]
MDASDDASLPVLKMILIGPSGAGKSALLTRYCDDEFEPDLSQATIGIDYKIKRLSVRGKAYRLTMFDTAGQERFRTLSTSFYRGAHAVLLVYDISSRASFLTMEKWFEEAETYTVEGIALCLVGAKLDKADPASASSPTSETYEESSSSQQHDDDSGSSGGGREVSTEEGKALADAHGALFVEVSSKTRENVRKAFVETVNRVVTTPNLLDKVRLNRSGSIALENGGKGGRRGSKVDDAGAGSGYGLGYLPNLGNLGGCSC